MSVYLIVLFVLLSGIILSLVLTIFFTQSRRGSEDYALNVAGAVTVQADDAPSIVADTVGFISDLPHELVESFRATLEEVGEADLILHVRDIASPDSEAQSKDVEAVLKQIETPEGKTRRVLEVWNKIDLLDEDARESVLGLAERLSREGRAVAVSAWTGEGIEPLRDTIAGLIDDDPETELVLLPTQGEALAWLYENGRVTGRETDDEGRTHVVVRLHPAALGRFERQFG